MAFSFSQFIDVQKRAFAEMIQLCLGAGLSFKTLYWLLSLCSKITLIFLFEEGLDKLRPHLGLFESNNRSRDPMLMPDLAHDVSVPGLFLSPHCHYHKYQLVKVSPGGSLGAKEARGWGPALEPQSDCRTLFRLSPLPPHPLPPCPWGLRQPWEPPAAFGAFDSLGASI